VALQNCRSVSCSTAATILERAAAAAAASVPALSSTAIMALSRDTSASAEGGDLHTTPTSLALRHRWMRSQRVLPPAAYSGLRSPSTPSSSAPSGRSLVPLLQVARECHGALASVVRHVRVRALAQQPHGGVRLPRAHRMRYEGCNEAWTMREA
jgi:hypothetical protein